MSTKLPSVKMNNHTGFIVALIILGLVSLYVVKSYIALFVLALIFVIVFDPLYQRMTKKVNHEGIASILTTGLVVLMVVIPIILIFSLAVNQAAKVVINIESNIRSNDPQIQQTITSLEILVESFSDRFGDYTDLENVDVKTVVVSGLKTTSNFITRSILPIISGIFSAVMQIILFIFFMIYLFPIRSNMMKGLSDISVLDSSIHTRFMKKFEAVTIATVKSTFMVGFFQGLLGGIMLAVLGYPGGAVLLGVLMGLASFIPGGSALVWLPLSIIMLILGEPIDALIYFLWGALVISSVDNVIRAKMLKGGDSGMPEILTLIAVLGGIETFGFWGFIYGPVLLALFFTALQVFRESKTQASPAKLNKPKKK